MQRGRMKRMKLMPPPHPEILHLYNDLLLRVHNPDKSNLRVSLPGDKK